MENRSLIRAFKMIWVTLIKSFVSKASPYTYSRISLKVVNLINNSIMGDQKFSVGLLQLSREAIKQRIRALNDEINSTLRLNAVATRSFSLSQWNIPGKSQLWTQDPIFKLYGPKLDIRNIGCSNQRESKYTHSLHLSENIKKVSLW